MKALLLAAVSGTALFAAGCGSGLCHVEVDAISRNPVASPQTYYLVPAMRDVSEQSLQFQEYAGYLHRVLQDKGFSVADPNEAELLVFVSYGLGAPQTSYSTFTTPIYGWTGGGTRTYSETTRGPDGTSHVTGTVTDAGRYGVVGAESHLTTHTTYPRYLFLGAYDARKLRQSNGQDPVEVWNTAVVSTGSSDDLRAVMPIMIAAAADYFGGNTGSKIKKTMFPGNRKVKWVKGESPAP
ncbi:MAG: hypothetical protein RBS72_19735 [Sedimentisphaerales bacterium]|jgi:hypothetical protein|nr:hypothetical protein [Sedimentisphaerales bacterium]HNY80585.1 hypothetical protein [Sedimentisphaerales bacterium]HOC65354.1 hypothetical protein [Sedimentisphaerales bacterium]HOH66309.1 hypothetical protein [Sedimentisphaerales bacterium]HPY52320.1 hypothetical protein [Sedimentisphaerales bacterium]